MFSKIEVNGANTHPLYQFLRTNSDLAKADGEGVKAITWNFEKFLVNGKGEVVGNYSPMVAPKDIEKDIEALLA